MSIGSILNTARSGLIASQRAVEVASNNVANAQTEGYSRQRVDLAAEQPIRFPSGEFGSGVRITGSSRARDFFLDASYRRAAGDAAGGRMRAETLKRMETILGEPGDNRLAAALDAFHSAWGDLATRPTASGVRGAVQETGAQVAQQLNRASGQLDAMQAETRQRMASSVDEVNALANEVAGLNKEIVAQESGGHSANTLRDARDTRIDRLVELTGGEVIEADNGGIAFLLGGLTLVDGTQVQPLSATTLSGVTEVTRANLTTRPVQIGGELGALRRLSVVDIPALQKDLDAFARGIVDGVNAIHRQGVTWSGTPPVAAPAGDFFASDATLTPETDPLRTARGIRLDSAVATSSNAIAASVATATGPGDATVALQLAGLRTNAVSFTNADGSPRASESPGAFLQRITTDVAFTTRSASDAAEIDAAIALQSESRRQSVSGVSVDEELVRLIKFQQSYAAAARLISIAESMSQSLLDIR